MQDKEKADDPEEVLTTTSDISSEHKPEQPARRESSKDNKFAFRKMKTPKKEKSTDRSDEAKYEGEGVIFKAKLIGVDTVPEPRGDKMCQDAMQRLKVNVRSTGPHKRKINVCVSLQGIKIKDDKFSSVIYHHAVQKISYISQDITDARAFGYVFGTTEEPHQFIAIKTEKPAFHVVLALRDLFQTVLHSKQEEMQLVKGGQSAPLPPAPPSSEAQKILPSSVSLVPSISDLNVLLQSKTPSLTTAQETPNQDEAKNGNIYIDVLLTEPFEMQEEELVDTKEPEPTVDDLLDLNNQLNKLQEGILQMDSSIAAFQEATSDPNDPFDTSFVLAAKRHSIPIATAVPLVASAEASSLPECDKYAALIHAADGGVLHVFPEADDDLPQLEADIARKMAAAAPPKPPRGSPAKSPPSDPLLFADLDPLGKDRPYQDKADFFRDVKHPPKKVLNHLLDPNREALPTNLPSPDPFPVDFSFSSAAATPLCSAPSSSLLTVDCSHLLPTTPIPIPPRHPSLLGKMDSPDQSSDYSEGDSPTGDAEGAGQHNKQVGVSRPRPRPSHSLNRGGAFSSHSLSSDSSSDYDVIGRENMQAVTRMLDGAGGRRLRAQSLCATDQTIFSRKKDPFADDFFSVPKKAGIVPPDFV